MKNASLLATTAFAGIAAISVLPGCATIAPPNSAKDQVPDYATPVLLKWHNKETVVAHTVPTRQFIADTIYSAYESPVADVEKAKVVSVIKSDNSVMKGGRIIKDLATSAGAVMTGIGWLGLGEGASKYGDAAQDGKLQPINNTKVENGNTITNQGSTAKIGDVTSTSKSTSTSEVGDVTAKGGNGGNAVNVNDIDVTAKGGNGGNAVNVNDIDVKSTNLNTNLNSNTLQSATDVDVSNAFNATNKNTFTPTVDTTINNTVGQQLPTTCTDCGPSFIKPAPGLN